MPTGPPLTSDISLSDSYALPRYSEREVPALDEVLTQGEIKLAEKTLETIRVTRPRGRSKRRPKKPVADRGYDSHDFRQALRRRGISMCIPPKRRPTSWRRKRGRPVLARKDDYRQRFKVERSFAWLGNFRRLLIRWEPVFRVYCSFFAFGVMVLCIKRLVRIETT